MGIADTLFNLVPKSPRSSTGNLFSGREKVWVCDKAILSVLSRDFRKTVLVVQGELRNSVLGCFRLLDLL